MMGKLHLLRYLLAVFAELPGSWKQKTRILRGLKHCILDYASDIGDITYDKLLKRFGEPKQVVFTYINEMETDELLDELRVNRKVITVTLAAVFLIIAAWMAYLAVCFLEVKADANGYLVVGEVEAIEQIEYIEGDN